MSVSLITVGKSSSRYLQVCTLFASRIRRYRYRETTGRDNIQTQVLEKGSELLVFGIHALYQVHKHNRIIESYIYISCKEIALS